MSDLKVDVKTEALQELAGSLGSFSSRVRSVLEEVKSKIGDSVGKMNAIRGRIQEKLEKAKEERTKAQEEYNLASDALIDCRSSQTRDEDGNLTPSCKAEYIRLQIASMKLKMAQDKEKKCQDTYDKACDIIDKANQSIGEYKSGPETEFDRIAGDYSKSAISEIGKRLEQLGEVLNSNLSLGIRYPVERPRPPIYTSRFSTGGKRPPWAKQSDE